MTPPLGSEVHGPWPCASSCFVTNSVIKRPTLPQEPRATASMIAKNSVPSPATHPNVLSTSEGTLRHRFAGPGSRWRHRDEGTTPINPLPARSRPLDHHYCWTVALGRKPVAPIEGEIGHWWA